MKELNNKVCTKGLIMYKRVNELSSEVLIVFGIFIYDLVAVFFTF